jgi:hypothetical protein
MRIELAGSLVRPEPIVLKFSYDQEDFNMMDYMDQGYTHFEVICIGGGGGSGGGINQMGAGTKIRSYGGAGGGGGYHRIRGLISAMSGPCPIVVGAAGAPGTDHISNPALTTDGGDGGYSSFCDDACRASGGKGGKHVQSNSTSVTTDADGGDGGIGDRIVAGGGAAGGLAGTPTPSGPGTPGTPGQDGTIFNNIGKGGGGGAGGVGVLMPEPPGITANPATAGGRGSYNPGDTSVYGPGGTPQNDETVGAYNTVPGGASGAKAAPLNGLPTVYGQSSEMGVVILRLTAE